MDITVAKVGLGNQPLIDGNLHQGRQAARVNIETRASNKSPATGHPVCFAARTTFRNPQIGSYRVSTINPNQGGDTL